MKAKIFFFWLCFVPLQDTTSWGSRRQVGTSGQYQAASVFVHPMQGCDLSLRMVFYVGSLICMGFERCEFCWCYFEISFTMQDTVLWLQRGGPFHRSHTKCLCRVTQFCLLRPQVLSAMSCGLACLIQLILRLDLIALSLFLFFYLTYPLFCFC